MAPIVSGLNVKKSLIPYEALYNPEIENFKRAERNSDLEPTPLTLLILKNSSGPSHNLEYRLVNEERGVSLSVKPHALKVKPETHGNATFVQQHKKDEKSRKSLVLAKKNPDIMSLEYSKASYQKPSLVPDE